VKFLLDAHIPPSLCEILARFGHEALHTSELPEQNQTRDGVLNEISMREQRVVITKDTDFYYSHILHGRPWKLLLVRTGNIRTSELKRLFEVHLDAIVLALSTHSLVEIDREAITALH
jgi:predicted nuclease of predicted toxin-antitoxin system